jgi:hypothetical protein
LGESVADLEPGTWAALLQFVETIEGIRVTSLSEHEGNIPMAVEQKTDWHKDPRTWELVQMLVQCRDALPAITKVRQQLYNVPPDLDKKIERLIEPWALPPGTEGGI